MIFITSLRTLRVTGVCVCVCQSVRKREKNVMRRRYNDDVRKNKMLAKFSFQQQQHEVKNAIMIFSSARSVKFRVLTTLKFFHLNFFRNVLLLLQRLLDSCFYIRWFYYSTYTIYYYAVTFVQLNTSETQLKRRPAFLKYKNEKN